LTLRDLHVVVGWTLTVANGLVGVWALAAHWRTGLRHRALWPATAAAEVLIVVQVILGVVTMRVNDVEVDGVHLFYGFVSAFTVGIIYSYRQQLEGWRYLLYGFGGLFLMGMGLRSLTISPVPG
jgi:hypothetical protein